MKKIILTLLVLSGATFSFAQTQEEKMREVSYRWDLTENGKVSFCEQYEFAATDARELFDSSVRYVKNTLGEGALIETDREKGIIRAKSLFTQVYPERKNADPAKSVSVQYDLVIEVGFPTVKVKVVLDRYDLPLTASGESDLPVDWYPVNELAKKQVYGLNIFYGTYKASESLFSSYSNYISGFLAQR